MLIRFLCLGLVRLFYRRIHITGSERVPSEGPVIVVSNHVNGLVDPMVLRMAIARPVAFLAKSTLFGNWLARKAMAAFGAIPVYRAKEADTSQNKKTFTLARALLDQKGWLALFPEGVSHNEPTLQPLKTGAARIALAADVANIQILPIGLSYNDKERFRLLAWATVGEPFTFDDLRDATEKSARATAQELTDRIAARLSEVVLQSEDRELWQGFRFVARWMRGQDDEELAMTLSKAYVALHARDPERALSLVEEARAFARTVRAVRVEDPRALDIRVSVWSALGLLLGLPIAALGFALAWLPYRLTGPVARKVAGKEDDLVSTIKLLAGLLFIGAGYVIEATVAGVCLGWPWGAALFAAAPLTGYVAMLYGDHWEVLRYVTRGRMLTEIKKRRAQFVGHMSEALIEGQT